MLSDHDNHIFPQYKLCILKYCWAVRALRTEKMKRKFKLNDEET